MRHIILVLLGSLFCTSSTIPVNGQIPGNTVTGRFLPYGGITYNFHTMRDQVYDSEEVVYRNSHFPGIEVGFTLLPKKESGWVLEYRNTFLGELAIFGIAKQTRNPYNGFLTDITDRTIGNGFLGRFDFGKKVISTDNRDLLAGFIISDKVILGTDDYPLMRYNQVDEDSYTNTGFHFTPGLYASYVRRFQNQSVLSTNISLCQSLFNLHQFGTENAIDHFVLPLFTELNVIYQMPGGIYLKMGAIHAASINGVPADARISAGAGYTFRYK